MEQVAAASTTGDNGVASTNEALNVSATPVENTGATTAGDPLATPAASPIDWLKDADEITSGYVQNKGWKSPGELLNSYQNLEKLLGADKAGNALVPPKADAPQGEWDLFYNKLGRPAEPTGYNIQVPEGFGDPNFAKEAATEFHKFGLTTKQAEGLTQWWNNKVGGQVQQTEQQRVAAFEADTASLKAEWGMKHDENVVIARNTASALGFDAKTIDALQASLGHKGVMNLLVKIGSKSGESDFVTGDIGATFSNNMTPGQAKAQIQAKMNDKNFVSRYLNKDTDAVEEMKRLHLFAYPSE